MSLSVDIWRAVEQGIIGPEAQDLARLIHRATWFNENDFGDALGQLARLTQHWAYHTHRSQYSEKGMLDWLILDKSNAGRRPLFWELKMPGGKATPAQQLVLHCVARDFPGADVRVLYPKDWDYIVSELTQPWWTT